MDLSPLWLFGWRCLHALALALFPWAFPLDAVVPPNVDGVMLRALVGWLGVAALVAFSLWSVRARSRWGFASITAVILVVGALIAAGVLPRATWPLGVSVWALFPLAWVTALGFASRVEAPRRTPALAGVAVLFVVSAALSFSRVRSVEAMWRATTELSPAHASAWRALVSLASERGDRAEVKRLLDRCVHASSASWQCALDRAELARRENDLPQLAESAAAVLAVRPENPRALTLRALGLAKQSPVPPEALEASRRAVAREPHSADAHYAVALALDAAGHTPEARTHVQAALTLGAGREALLLQSILALRAGDPRAARAGVERALRDSANDARAYYTLGLVEQQAGHYNAAREAYLHSLQLDRTGYAARYNLAALAHGAGANDEARHHLEVILRDHPDDPAATTLLHTIEGEPRMPPAALRTGAP